LVLHYTKGIETRLNSVSEFTNSLKRILEKQRKVEEKKKISLKNE
jgi:hypothetical protein